VLGALALALFVVEVVLPFLHPVTPMPAEIALGSLFLGPSALPNSAFELVTDPLHHLFAAALGALGARGAFAKSRVLRPETNEARAFDRAGLRFVAFAVLSALLSLSGLLVRALFR
jgi:hypothetical protein